MKSWEKICRLWNFFPSASEMRATLRDILFGNKYMVVQKYGPMDVCISGTVKEDIKM